MDAVTTMADTDPVGDVTITLRWSAAGTPKRHAVADAEWVVRQVKVLMHRPDIAAIVDVRPPAVWPPPIPAVPNGHR